MDLRGHGDSDWHPKGAYQEDQLVADIEAVIAGLGWERFVLVGHSLGGRVSMLYAGQHPDRLAGLVIVDSAPTIDERGAIRISQDTSRNRAPSFASVDEYARMLSLAYPAATPKALQRMARHGVRQGGDGRYILKMDTTLRNFVAGADPEERETRMQERAQMEDEMWLALEKIACPTLVVRGAASDILGPEIADRMVEEALPSGELAVVAQAGHSVMTDNPEGFNQAVSRFVLGES
jgi:pimeloyl-ACP methyl ester carboxylesterase